MSSNSSSAWKRCSILLAVLLLKISLCAVVHSTKQCGTESCLEITNRIRQTLNISVDPCDDFYDYACGSWPTVTQFQADSTYKLLEKQIDQAIRKGLDQSYWHQSNAVRIAGHLYRQCALLNNNEALLYNILKPIGGWENIGKSVSNQENFTPWYETLLKAYINLAFEDFTRVLVYTTSKRDFLRISVNQMPTYRRALKMWKPNNSELLQAYREYITKSAQVLWQAQEEALSENVENLINFEMNLIQWQYNWFYNEGELPSGINFDWIDKVIRPLAKHFQTSKTTLSSTYTFSSHFKKLIPYLNEINGSSVFENYLGWQVVRQYGPLVSENLRFLEYQFKQAVGNEPKVMPDRKEFCVQQIRSHLPWVASRLYIEQDFSVPQDKQVFSDFIDEIQLAAQEVVDEKNWMEEADRNATVGKLSNLTKNIAYPDWLLNDTALDELYWLNDPNHVQQVLASANFLESLIQFKLLSLNHTLHNRPTQIPGWREYSPINVNGYSFQRARSIVYPAATMKPPFYNYLPMLNYGSLGLLVGHEMMHHLDTEGRLVDPDGKKDKSNPWWSNQTIEGFLNRSKCLEEQYSNQLNVKTGLYLNGTSLLDENIADNGGLHAAYRAFQRFLQRTNQTEQTIFELSDFYPGQLFFITFAQSLCDNISAEKVRKQANYATHTPPRYQVNIPLWNTPEFASAFNCPATSRMNPSEKCLLW